MTRRRSLLGAALAASFLLGEARTQAAPSNLVEIQRSIHFLALDGSDLVVAPGKYRIEAAGDEELRLVPAEGDPLLVDASLETHDRQLEQPTVMNFQGSNDLHYLSLELPDGRRIAALGSYSGISERGGRDARRRLARKRALARARARKSVAGKVKEAMARAKKSRARKKPGKPARKTKKPAKKKKRKAAPSRYFDEFNWRKRGHDWANHYILALLSYFSYDGSVGAKGGDFAGFPRRFKKKFEKWGATIDDPSDFIDTRGKIFEHTQVMLVNLPKAVIVVFRGSESVDAAAIFRDWILTDANMFWKDLPSYSRSGFMAPKVKVHTGFWNGLNSCWASLIKKVKARMKGGRKLFITGHSLGGALASLAGIRFAREEKIPVQGVYTYASPRVGNDEFRVVYHSTQHLRKTQRWVNGLDIVPMIPPGFPLQVPKPPLIDVYRHVGQNNNIHLPLFGKQTQCRIKIGEKNEIVGVGNPGRHSMTLYAQSIYHRMPKRLRSALPRPPK